MTIDAQRDFQKACNYIANAQSVRSLNIEKVGQDAVASIVVEIPTGHFDGSTTQEHITITSGSIKAIEQSMHDKNSKDGLRLIRHVKGICAAVAPAVLAQG